MQRLKRRLMSGGAWAFGLGSKILVALAGLISTVLLARLLLAYSILNVGTSLGALGLTGTVVRLVAQGMGLMRRTSPINSRLRIERT